MTTSDDNAGGGNFWHRAWHLYADGFRAMTVGRTLWLIIVIKLIIFFAVIKVLFFPDFLAGKASDDQGKAEYVRQQLTGLQSSPLPPPEGGDAESSD